MRSQAPRELARRGDLARQTHVQRAQPAQQKPGGVGREHAADRAPDPDEALAEGGVARRDDAGEQVGVAGEVLGRALPGEVGAEVERTLQERRRERVVAAQEGPACVCGSRGVADVGDAQERVRRRLDDRERRTVAGTAEAVRIAEVVAAHVDAEVREHLGAEQLDLVVAARRDDERLALPE